MSSSPPAPPYTLTPTGLHHLLTLAVSASMPFLLLALFLLDLTALRWRQPVLTGVQTRRAWGPYGVLVVLVVGVLGWLG